MERDELNEQGIFLLDIYMLDYYGIKVFFQVCKTRKNSVYLVELATKRYKNGTMLTKTIKASKKPIIITSNNTYTKSTYKVYPVKLYNEYWLPIDIKYGSSINNLAKEYVDYPSFGTAYAIPIKDYLNKYWEQREKKQKEEKIWLA